ncbi:MAG: membrane protein insertion efficiency factor YidD [Planctomycetota bacterium]
MCQSCPLPRRILAAPFLLPLAVYRRFISPWTPATCRFSPTCSAYAEEALKTHALPRALLLIAWRILRCQPLCSGGYDPVPKRAARADRTEEEPPPP